MSWVGEAILNLSNWWHGVEKIKANVKNDPNALRIGVLSAAAINYTAIIDPCQTHPGAVLVGIAARDKAKAQAQIDKYKLQDCKAYAGYQALLDDPSVDAVYISLPNGLHAEWTMKALEAGKHVLVEKPIASNADQVRRIQEVAAGTKKVVVEAFHWRFHPAAHTVKQVIESGKYGAPKSIYARLTLPGGGLNKDDIRFQYALAGGASMDLTYVYSACTYLGVPNITKCDVNFISAVPRLNPLDKNVDDALDAQFTIEDSSAQDPRLPAVQCHVQADLASPPLFGFIPRVWMMTPFLSVELERASVSFSNFILPTYGHSITITENDTGRKEVLKSYKDGPLWRQRGEVWWTTYRYQLEAFVDAVRAKERDEEHEGPWVTLEESEQLMDVIDKGYEKMGLPRRGE